LPPAVPQAALPAFFPGQQAPSQIAPTFATGTTSTAQAPRQQMYTLRTDASGKQYYVPI